MSRSKVSFFSVVSGSFAGTIPVRKTNNSAANGMVRFMMKLSGVSVALLGGRLSAGNFRVGLHFRRDGPLLQETNQKGICNSSLIYDSQSRRWIDFSRLSVFVSPLSSPNGVNSLMI